MNFLKKVFNAIMSFFFPKKPTVNLTPQLSIPTMYPIKADMVRAIQDNVGAKWLPKFTGSPESWALRMAVSFGGVEAFKDEPGVPHLDIYSTLDIGSHEHLLVAQSLVNGWVNAFTLGGMPATGFANTKAIPAAFSILI